MYKNTKAQIWVETVIYTLIAFILIGAVLAFVKPKIEEIQDKSIIEQTLGLIDDIDSQIRSVVQGGPGNKRIIEIGIKKGELKIDGGNDALIFEIESRHAYTEPGTNVPIGNINAYTEEKGKFNIVTLTTNYSQDYNITYQRNDGVKIIGKAATPYKLSIANNGKNGGAKPNIDITVT